MKRISVLVATAIALPTCFNKIDRRDLIALSEQHFVSSKRSALEKLLV